MPQAEATESIDLSDFSPGIFSGFHAGNGPQAAPDGAAQETDTWGCYALPSGGLVPMPALEFTKNFSINFEAGIPGGGTDNLTGGRMPTGIRKVAILDIQNFPGIRAPLYTEDSIGVTTEPRLNTDDSGIHDYFMFITHLFANPANASATTWYSRKAIYEHRMFLQGTSLPDKDDPTTLLRWFGQNLYGPSEGLNAANFGFGAIDLGRASGINRETKPGQPHFKFSIGNWYGYNDEDSGTSYRAIYIYPGDENYDIYPLLEDVGSPFVFSHQGRSIWSEISNFYGVYDTDLTVVQGAQYSMNGDGSGGLQLADTLYWTKVNSRIVENGPTEEGTVFIEENPTGFGTFSSMNSSELFLVKNVGGAGIIRGSLNNPTVVRLPGVESTNGVVTRPAITPLGCVYGTRSGVWVWNGSDTSQNLSPNLDGYFYYNPATASHHPAQLTGRFGYHYPFVFAPQSWVLDTRTGGWFRLHDPSDICKDFWNVSTQGRMYGTPATIDIDQSNTGVQSLTHLYSYKMDTQTDEWSWKSQPLQRTKNRRVDIREIQITGHGVGTIAVTLTGLDGTTVTKTFTLTSNQPVTMSQSVKMSSHDVVVKFVSTATTPGNPAPSLIRSNFPYREAQGTTVSGSEA